METTLQTIAPVAELAPLAWAVTNKSGDVTRRTAYCATSQVFAPKAARLADGQARDLAQLLSGCYRPVLKSVSDKMTAKEKLALYDAGVNVNRDKPTKGEMVPFADAVVQLWGDKKGEKLAIAAMLKEYITTVTASVPAAS